MGVIEGVDAADAVADGDAAEEFAVVEAADSAAYRIVKEILAGRRGMGAGAMHVPGGIDADGQVL